MKRLIGSPLTLIKVGILAVAVVATLTLAQQPNAESATDTRIFLSYSGTVPIHAAAIIVNRNGVSRDIFIWAVNVKEPTGVSGFNIAVEYDDSVISVSEASGDGNGIGDSTWLFSSGRQGACIPDLFPTPGRIIGLCSTLTPAPPLGPTGTGLIGHFVLTPGSVSGGASVLALVEPEVCPPSCVGVQGTFLLDTKVNPDDTERIPLTLQNSTVIFLGCADNTPPPNGDGVIDLPNDILGVILRFQMTSEHNDWDPLFDINDDEIIDLPNDILGTILQFQLPCTHE